MADMTEAEIVINAPASEIMDVIADLENYPAWSEGVQKIDVLTSFEDGRPKTARWTVDAGIIKDVYDLEYTWDGNHSVSWTLIQGGMLKLDDGTYTLDEQGGETKVSYKLKVDLSIPMLGMMKRKAEKSIVDTALKGLKKRVEGS
ncbi:MAG: SRPBCC family protein [Actinobacteria bacterium]|nr:SRPBCC family protein [Actinomycetota bacterium]MCB9412261.1 SRPBCC family protein [Actinomycetota bacterium]